jgi:hypothetical protein
VRAGAKTDDRDPLTACHRAIVAPTSSAIGVTLTASLASEKGLPL